VQPTVLAEIKRVFEHRSPRKINATNTEKNLKVYYYYYGYHDSVNDNENEVDKVLLKDHRRGNTLLVDRRLFACIPNSHLCPQGLADLFDAWKEARHISDIISCPPGINVNQRLDYQVDGTSSLFCWKLPPIPDLGVQPLDLIP
jgi:hypothetical protein